MDVLGIDIGGSGIKGAPVDTVSGILKADRFRIPTPQPATPSAVAGVVAEIAKHFDWSGPIGAAFPARVKLGVAYTAANIDSSWIGTNGARMIADETGCPVTLVNDADAAGVAEMTFGNGRDRMGLVLLLTFGTGIGSALFIDRQLVPNTEFGHIKMHGKPAEHYASNRIRKEEDLSWKDWAARVQEYLDYIEFIIAPDLIMLGGGISKQKRRVKYFDHLSTEAELMTARLRNEAGIVGAAHNALVQQDVHAHP